MELKKTLAMLASGMLLTGLPAMTHAQDAGGGAAAGPFADVPADHWAYNAVKTLQDAKIVIGYPDGTYGGRRPMTRYEFATAIARLLPLLNQNNNYATKDDLAALRSDLESKLAANQAALDALTRLVNEFQPELQRLGQDVTAIQTRLANLEGRVAAVEAEQQRLRITGDVNIIGEAANSTHKNGGLNRNPINAYTTFADKNGVSQAGVNNNLGFDAVGRIPTPPTAASHRFFENSDVYHDILLHLRGRLSDTATANIDLNFTNYLTSLADIARAGEAAPIGALGNGGGSYNSYVYQAYLDAPVSLGPLGGAELRVGRFGNQFTKWTLKQEDADIYTNLYQTDSGNIVADGGSLGFKLGPVGVQGFAGKFNTTPLSQAFVGTVGFAQAPGSFTTANALGTQRGAHPLGTFTSNGTSINHAAPIVQGAGARFTFGKPENLVFGATVEQFAIGSTINGLAPNQFGGAPDPNRTTGTVAGGNLAAAQFNRVSVYGLDVNGGLPFAFLGQKKGAITVSGAYNVSAHGGNSGFNNIGNKQRYQSHEEMVGFNLGKLAFQGGYQFVGPYYSAPGYWGKLGAWTNPTNVKGPVYFAKYPITPKLSLNADYEQYRAAYSTNENGTQVVSPLQGRDHVNRYQVGLGYGLTSAYAVDLGYERVEYDLRGDNGTLNNVLGAANTHGKPVEDYITLGVGHSFNQNTSFKLLYQIVHYNDKGTGFQSTGNGDGNYAGNIAVGQFSLKF